MPEELFIPQLGQTVEEVTIVEWLVKDGAQVTHGQPVLDVETDKAVFPLEANAKGTIHIGPYQPGQVVPVLTVVALIGRPEDKFDTQAGTGARTPGSEEDKSPIDMAGSVAASGTLPRNADGTERLFASPRARKLAAEKNVDLSVLKPTGYEGARVIERDVLKYLVKSPKASPLAQRMAAETGVDLRAIAGTGPSGRIVKEDIARLAQSQSPLVDSRSPIENPQAEILERIPLKGVRAIIAERMAASVHSTARVTLIAEADATEFVAARERLKSKVAEAWGFAPGYNDLLAKIVASALRQFPYMNARLAPDAIEIMAHVNIGMAVDTQRGLLVPVIRDVDRKNLRQFGEEFRALADRARAGRALPEDLNGGTFTITSLGTYDIDAFTPVINLPEAAILGVGRIAPKPLAKGDQVVIRQAWTLSLVFDHRLVDGAPAARFLQTIKALIEDPALVIAYL